MTTTIDSDSAVIEATQIDDTDSPYTTQGEQYIFVDTSNAAVTVTLATADVTNGREIRVVDTGENAGTNNITIDTEGSENINPGANASISLTIDGTFVDIFSDGSNWFSDRAEDRQTVKTSDLIDGAGVSHTGELEDINHATKHEPGGSDEVTDIDINNTGTNLSAHNARHENGGADEINVGGLSGDLADAQDPKSHASSHESGGSDTITVGNLVDFDPVAVLIDTEANRPAAGTADRLFIEQDTGNIQRDNGTSWDIIGTTNIAETDHVAADHENGGSLELNVGGLSGQLADVQTVQTQEDGTNITTADTLDFTTNLNVTDSGSGVATVDAANAGGATTLIESQTPSGVSSADFTTGIDSDHSVYGFYISNLIPATDSVRLFIRTSTDGGSTFDSGSSDYRYASKEFNNGGAESLAGSSGTSEIRLGDSNIGSASGEPGISASVLLYAPSDTAVNTQVKWETVFAGAGGALFYESGSGERTAAEDVNGVRFLFGSGNIESGTIELIGVN